MDERQKMQHLFKFDLWCTYTLVDMVTEHTPFKEEQTCISLLSHIINAQNVWFRRVIINSTENEVGIWDEHDLDTLKKRAKKANQQWMDFVADHEVEMETQIDYQNSSGTNFSNSVWEICNHLVIHGQHHRAQISLYLRNCDIKPPAIDYIHYARMSKSAELLN